MLPPLRIPGAVQPLLTAEQVRAALTTPAGRRDAERLVRRCVLEALRHLDDEENMRLRRIDGLRLDYCLTWGNGPTIAQVQHTLYRECDLGPVRIIYDHSSSRAWLQSRAEGFLRWTGLPAALIDPTSILGRASAVWGTAPLSGVAAGWWMWQVAEGWLCYDDVPRVTPNDLDAWIESGVQEWATEAYRLLGTLPPSRRAVRHQLMRRAP